MGNRDCNKLSIMSYYSNHLFVPQVWPLPSTHPICQLCSKPPYTDPRIPQCLHSFCVQCLIERSRDKQKMECPTCQRSITIPEGGVNAIPQNLHLGFEVEVAGYMSKIGRGGEKSCDVCIDGGKGPAVVFCCTCGQLLCTYCHEYHKSSKELSLHQVIKLDQESARLPSIMTPTEEQHHLKTKIYCETCQRLVNRDSAPVLHNQHRFANGVCNIAKVCRDEMIGALECAKKLTSVIGDKDKMAEQIETSRENATLRINQAFEQIHQAIEERKKTLLLEMEAISLSKTTTMSLQKKIQDEIGCYTEMTSHILQTHTDHEVVALGDLLPTELKATLKKVEGVSFSASQSSDIYLTLPTDSLTKAILHIWYCTGLIIPISITKHMVF